MRLYFLNICISNKDNDHHGKRTKNIVYKDVLEASKMVVYCDYPSDGVLFFD
jgi:hypothetical protein